MEPFLSSKASSNHVGKGTTNWHFAMGKFKLTSAPSRKSVGDSIQTSRSDENRAAHTVSPISGLALLHIQCLLLIKELGSFRWEHKAGRIL